MTKALYTLALFVTLASAASFSLPMGRRQQPDVVFGEPHRFPAAVHSYLSTKWSKYYNGNPIDVTMSGNINPLGIFYVNISVGTPRGQYVSVAVDSGSFTMLVPGPKCMGCPAGPKKYDYKQSKTGKPLLCSSGQCGKCKGGICSWSNTYQTCNLTDTTQKCTASGLVYSDYFQIGSLKSKNPTRFGVIDHQTANFQQLYVIDGILGFGSGYTFGQPAQFLQLAKEGQISRKFGLCFDASGSGGVLTMGEPDDSLYMGDLVRIPMVTSSPYVIPMTDVKVGGTSIGLPAYDYQSVPTGGCIVDSGTNILLFPDSIFTATKQSFLDMCSSTSLRGICDVDSDSTLFNNLCYSLSDDEVDQFPDLELNFRGVPMTLPSTSYLLPKVGDSNKRCLGIQNTGPNGILIIGDTTMEQYYTVFDIDRRSLFIAPVNKDNCRA